MINNEQIVEKIVEGIQERKGKTIAVINLSEIPEAPCSFFIICEGDSKIHVNAIATSVIDVVRGSINVKPYAFDGFENSEWIALDYGQIIVHVFQRHARDFYNIEKLWPKAKIETYQDIL